MEKWYNLSAEETLKALESAREGLPEEKAKERLKKHGPNELQGKRKVPWTAAILAGIPLPVVAVQILWINLVTDGVCTIPLSLEPKHQDPPRRAGAGIVYGGMMMRIAFVALFMAAGTFLLFKWELPRVGLDEARTIAFCALVAFQWFNALNARSDYQSLFSLGFFSNRWLLGGIALAVVLQLMIVDVPLFQKLFYTVPLGPDDWGVILLAAGSIFIAEEIRKALGPRIFHRGK